MKKILVLMAAILLVAAATAIADPITTTTLDKLLAINGFTGGTIDDKTFSNFTYSSSSSGGAIAIPASGVTVIPITTQFNPGFDFEAAWAVTSGQTQDSLIKFDVQVNPGGNAITDMSATMSGYGFITTGNVAVAETSNVSGFILLTASGGGITDKETVTFDPTTGVIHVVKDISLSGGTDLKGFATVSDVTDQFSEVPEPATMLLLGSGLLGMGVYARKRFSKR